MSTNKLQATALVARNSISYVSHVFALNNARQLMVSVADEKLAQNLAGIDIDQLIVPDEEFGWFSAHHELIHEDTPAQVTYTSGTEGPPKGIVLSHANLSDTAERILAEMEITADIREYVGVPVNYSFGMGRIRAISAIAGKAYLPARGFDPLEFARMLGAGEVNALSAVPTLLRTLLATPDVIRDSGGELRWLEIGSQYMSGDEKRGIRAMFPNAKIVQHYGLTEASRTTFLQVSTESDDLLESVGRPVGSSEIEIAEDQRIKIRGPHVARLYVDSDGLHDLLDAKGWLVTNDLGSMDGGRLYFNGRADDLINCGGVKINPDMVEARIRSLLEVDIAITKVPDEMRGDGVLVAVESDEAAIDSVRVAATTALKEAGVDAGSSLHIVAVELIPKTATGKPQRRLLTEQFAGDEMQVPTSSATNATSSEAKDVMGFFRELFPGQPITSVDSFETLGGDSLNFIRFSLNFERRFGALPENWEVMSVSELKQHTATSEKSSWRRLEGATLTRAVGMICIVALHFEVFRYSWNWGAAFFLYMLAGYSVARFQLPEIFRTGSVKVLFGTIQRIAIPTLIVVAALQLKATSFELKPLLLISNFFDPIQYKLTTFYFAEIFIQLLLLAALLFSFPWVRSVFSKKPILSAIVLLALVSGAEQVIQSFWDTRYIYHRTPNHYAWCFACGILMASAHNLPQRFLALAVVAFSSWIVWSFTSAMFWVVGACAILLFVREIWVIAPVKTLIAEIAGASMFIYLTHYNLIAITARIFGEEMRYVNFIFALMFGVFTAYLYDWGEGRIRESINARKLVLFSNKS